MMFSAYRPEYEYRLREHVHYFLSWQGKPVGRVFIDACLQAKRPTWNDDGLLSAITERMQHIPTLIRAAILFFILELSAQGQPARIVSTFPSITETIFALGAGQRVVGVSNYCNYPPEVLLLPKVGGYVKPDPEKIALLRPDLVIIQKSTAGLAERLSALHIQHVDVKLGSLSDIYSMIGDIGRAVGSSRKADELNAGIRSKLDAIRANTENAPRPSVLIVVGRTPGLLTNLIAVGTGTYLGELLDIAGGVNVLTGTAIAYPHISLETVLRLNPDVILDISDMGDAGTAKSFQEVRLREPWMSRSELKAVKDGRVFGLASESIVTPGPRVLESVEKISAKINPKINQR